MEIQKPEQPNTTPPADGMSPEGENSQMSNMQNSPLFTDTPAKKSNTAIIILIVVIALVIVAGVIFFLMAKNPKTNTSPVVEGQPIDTTQQQAGAFGQQETSNRPLNSGSEIAAELNDVTAELDSLEIDSFEEEFAEIDKILQDINF